MSQELQRVDRSKEYLDRNIDGKTDRRHDLQLAGKVVVASGSLALAAVFGPPTTMGIVHEFSHHAVSQDVQSVLQNPQIINRTLPDQAAFSQLRDRQLAGISRQVTADGLKPTSYGLPVELDSGSGTEFLFPDHVVFFTDPAYAAPTITKPEHVALELTSPVCGPLKVVAAVTYDADNMPVDVTDYSLWDQKGEPHFENEADLAQNAATLCPGHTEAH
ncbi:MAG: hypothetical protein JWN38_622 [Candidatus Saccharibacteria bacterium]|nr:hypothetical protein [Candidatus Saccharibacteria bacterium]